ncbi:MAG: hypothetical protein DSZ28_00205, partial [Thiothrix sp.]
MSPIINAWRDSGISQTAFCKSRKLSLSQFTYWRAKILAKPEVRGKIPLGEQLDIINKKSHVIGEQQKQIHLLEEQLRLLRQQRYGKSSEKNEAQGELFNEA